MSPALNESSAIRHFEGNDAIEICDRIAFDFNTRLPHMVMHVFSYFFCENFMLYIIKRVAGGLLVKALDCGWKGPGFQSHLQQIFLLWVHSVLPQKLSSRKLLVAYWLKH